MAVLGALMWVGISTIRADFPSGATTARTDSAPNAASAPSFPSVSRYSPGAPNVFQNPSHPPVGPYVYPSGFGSGATTTTPPPLPALTFVSAATALPGASESFLERQLADLERLRVAVAQADRAFRASQEPGLGGYPTSAEPVAADRPARMRPDISAADARNLQADVDVL